MTEDEMVGQCHRSDQHEFDPTQGGSGRQEGLSGPCGHEESDMTKRLNNNKPVLNRAELALHGIWKLYLC